MAGSVPKLSLKYAVIAGIAVTLLFVVLHNWARLRAMETQAQAVGQVMWVGGGDIQLRDLPKYHQTRRGHLLADPHFEGEPHWYPPMNPWLASAVTAVTGARGPAAFFRLEVLAVAAALGAFFVALYGIGGWVLLAMVPFAAALGWLQLGGGLYPNDTARAPLIFSIVMIGRALVKLMNESHEERWPWRNLAVGLSVGVLGLWNGASFFAALITWAACEGASLFVRVRRGMRWHALWSPSLAAAGIAVVMSLLVLPQLFHYGHVKMAGSARKYLEPFYGGGVDLSAASKLPLLPRGLSLWIVCAAVLVILVARLWRLVPLRRLLLMGVPFGIAYGACLTICHLGYGMNDPKHPNVARLIARFIPAPPHGFLSISYTLWWVLVLAAAGLMVSLLILAACRKWSERLTSPWLRRLGFCSLGVACALTWYWLPRDIAFYSRNEDAGLLQWARQAKRITGASTVFIQYPGHMEPLAGFRVFHFTSPDHANHYVQPARQVERDLANRYIAMGDAKRADDILTAHRVAYFIDDSQGKDTLIERCSGPTIIAYAGFRLLPKVPCR